MPEKSAAAGVGILELRTAVEQVRQQFYKANGFTAREHEKCRRVGEAELARFEELNGSAKFSD